MKKVSLIIMFTLLIVGLMGCTANDELSKMNRQLNRNLELASGFNDQKTQALDHEVLISDHIQLLASGNINHPLTIEDQELKVKALIQTIMSTRIENINLYEQNIALRNMFISNVSLFRNQELTLTKDHKDIIKDLRQELIEHRQEVIKTNGEIKLLMKSLEGKFNHQHIEEVILILNQILNILEIRQTFLIHVSDTLVEVNQIIESYLIGKSTP
jgi:hypothetical protein